MVAMFGNNGGGPSNSTTNNGNGGSPTNRRNTNQQSAAIGGTNRSLMGTPPSPVRARVRIVPEIFNDYNQIGLKQALGELDAALEERCPVIVIEPMNLGEQTSRWIRLGNGLHKAAVLCGGASTLGFWIGDPWTKTSARGVWYCLCGALATTAMASHLVHVLSWQSDPCALYQVETDSLQLARLLADANYYSTGGNGHSSSNGIQAASIVVLVKKDLRGRRILQNSVAFMTLAAIAYRVYKSW